MVYLTMAYDRVCIGEAMDVFFRKELPQHSFTLVVSEASTPPAPPLAWSTRASATHVKTCE